jgi:hypothetical protein
MGGRLMEDPRRVRLRVLELETGWDNGVSVTEPFELHEGERIAAVVPMTGSYLIAYIETPAPEAE